MTFDIARLPATASDTSGASPRECALLISDLHLSPALPRTVAVFEAFLQGPARQAGELFILGDFFEYWVGDDMLDAGHDDPASLGAFARRIAAALAELSAAGTVVYLMCGNRDFLLGERFARAALARLLHDPCLAERFGQRIVLSHGDMLCTDDIGYMRFRRLTRTPWLQRLFLALPLRWRMRVAERMRQRSASRGPQRMIYGDVNHSAVRALLSAAGATTLVHGHTHRPAHHTWQDDAVPCHRWVLPDWEYDHNAPRGGYLQWDTDGLRAVRLAGAPAPN